MRPLGESMKTLTALLALERVLGRRPRSPLVAPRTFSSRPCFAMNALEEVAQELHRDVLERELSGR